MAAPPKRMPSSSEKLALALDDPRFDLHLANRNVKLLDHGPEFGDGGPPCR